MEKFKEKYSDIFKKLSSLYENIDFNSIYDEINSFQINISNINLQNFTKYLINCEAYRDRLLFLETQHKNLLTWFEDLISPLTKAGIKYAQGSNKETREASVYDEFIEFIKMNIEIKNLYNTCYMKRVTFDKKIEVISRWLSAYQNSLRLNPLGQAVDMSDNLEIKNSKYPIMDNSSEDVNDILLVKSVDLMNL